MRYFFNVRDGEELVCDKEGSELPNLEAARQEARMSARDFAVDDLRAGHPVAARQIEITDSAGHMLETMQTRAVLR
jgi:hypothetical protein